ncbi:glycoside hydrolase, partial [Candidatus Saccharibacteria bacterium]|nr:glycoside hydrolase [Candidatus Saccharibacteria bacterium]
IQELYVHEMPLWIKMVKSLHLDSLFTLVRSDTKYLPAYQRIDTIDALNFYSVARKLRRRKYETRLVLRYGQLTMEDIGFNSILIRANTLLCQIASEIKADVPEWLLERFKRAPKALESLWSEEKGEYFSRNFQTFESIEQSSIMTFLPLYSGAISKKRAGELVTLLRSKDWWLPYPVPSVPKNSQYFDELRYWQGPTWVNTNWLVADGLKRYGYVDEAQAIIDRTIELATLQGLSEYFSPVTGSPAGANSFSWTAALVLDMLYSS